jgi:hypothetical protein
MGGLEGCAHKAGAGEWREVYAKPETEGDGIFYLSWYEGRKRRREAIQAATLRLAQKAQDVKPRDLDAIERLKGNGTYTEPEKATERLTLADAAAEYLADIKAHKSAKILSAYAKALEYFRESCTKTFVDPIDRRDLWPSKRTSRTRRDNPTAAPGTSFLPSWAS